MLQWLAGQRPPDTDDDLDTTGCIEPPETPAPVFAVRAFKHAFFGTPQATQKRHRSHSNSEAQRPRLEGNRPNRPGMIRPKSTSDARALLSEDNAPLPSPTKGILMTPGTANGRRKTVSFNESVVDNEAKRPLAGSKSGLPDDFPGKFPSPWTAQDIKLGETTRREHNKNRSELTERLQKVKEDSAKKLRTEPHVLLPSEMREVVPGIEHGDAQQLLEQLQKEYDEYRNNTTREVRKLVTKQKAAKGYAKEMDEQCFKLRDQLRQEKQKIEKLEEQVNELQTNLRDAQGRVQNQVRAPSPKDTNGDWLQQQQKMSEELRRARDDASRIRIENSVLTSELAKAKIELETLKVGRSRLSRDPSHQDVNNLWPGAASNTQRPGSSDSKAVPGTGRTVTSGTGATPLRTLSINTLAAESDKLLNNTRTRRTRARPENIPPSSSEPGGNPACLPQDSMKRKDSYDLPCHPLPHVPTASEVSPAVERVQRCSGRKTQQNEDAASSMPPPLSKTSPDLRSQSPSAPALGAANIEGPVDVLPPSKQWHSLVRPDTNSTKTPALVHGIPQDATAKPNIEGGKRLMSRSGKELSAEFQEATRAKYAARRIERGKASAVS